MGGRRQLHCLRAIEAHGTRCGAGLPPLGDYFDRLEGRIATVLSGFTETGEAFRTNTVLLGNHFFDPPYLESNNLSASAIAAHEALHIVSGSDDLELARDELGLTFASGDPISASAAIQKFLEGGCKR